MRIFTYKFDCSSLRIGDVELYYENVGEKNNF